MSEKKTLEDLANNVKRSVTFPTFLSLNEFETKIKRIAKRYGWDERLHQEGSHK